MRYFICLTLLFLSACNKPLEKPETLDPIYADLVKESANVYSLLQQEKATLETHQNELKAVTPQTGQIKYAQKRVDESAKLVDRLDQLYRYYLIKAQSRLEHDRRQYTKAFEDKTTWPDPAEFEAYKVQKSLEQASRHWNHKQRQELSKASLGIEQKAPALPEK